MDATTSGYVYIATTEGLDRSYVGVSASLLDMDWIPKYGVDNLVWFEGYVDIALAQARADQLRNMSEDERRSLVLRGNPAQVDLCARIWSSNEEDA
jgi:predicted GIY-YIG superfamily endonuclease